MSDDSNSYRNSYSLKALVSRTKSEVRRAVQLSDWCIRDDHASRVTFEHKVIVHYNWTGADYRIAVRSRPNDRDCRGYLKVKIIHNVYIKMYWLFDVLDRSLLNWSWLVLDAEVFNDKFPNTYICKVARMNISVDGISAEVKNVYLRRNRQGRCRIYNKLKRFPKLPSDTGRITRLETYALGEDQKFLSNFEL